MVRFCFLIFSLFAYCVGSCNEWASSRGCFMELFLFFCLLYIWKLAIRMLVVSRLFSALEHLLMLLPVLLCLIIMCAFTRESKLYELRWEERWLTGWIGRAVPLQGWLRSLQSYCFKMLLIAAYGKAPCVLFIAFSLCCLTLRKSRTACSWELTACILTGTEEMTHFPSSFSLSLKSHFLAEGSRLPCPQAAVAARGAAQSCVCWAAHYVGGEFTELQNELLLRYPLFKSRICWVFSGLAVLSASPAKRGCRPWQSDAANALVNTIAPYLCLPFWNILYMLLGSSYNDWMVLWISKENRMAVTSVFPHPLYIYLFLYIYNKYIYVYLFIYLFI